MLRGVLLKRILTGSMTGGGAMRRAALRHAGAYPTGPNDSVWMRSAGTPRRSRSV